MNKYKISLIAFAATLASGASFAATEPEVVTAATGLITKAGEYSATFIPVAVAFSVALVALGLVKTYIARSAR